MSAPVSHSGPEQTVLQSFAQWTVEVMACAQGVSVNVKMVGEEPAVKNAPVTQTVLNMDNVKMENVNAAQDGRGSSVP